MPGPRLALERPDDPIGDPAAIELPGLGAYALTIDETRDPARIKRHVTMNRCERGGGVGVEPADGTYRRFVGERQIGCSPHAIRRSCYLQRVVSQLE